MTLKTVIFRSMATKATMVKLASKKVPAHQRNIDEKLMFGGVVEKKSEKKRREKKERLAKEKETAPDSEVYWLQNFSSDSIKMYRKMPNGRYKEIDKNKLIEKIKLEANEKKYEPVNNKNNVELASIDQSKLLEKIKIGTKEKTIEFPSIIVRELTSVPMLLPEGSPPLSYNKDEQFAYPSVTRILSDTMGEDAKNALEKWKQRMIAELGEEGFQKYNKEQLSFGARFHSNVKRFLEKNDFELDDDLNNVWNSVQNVLPNLTDVRLIEANVAHPKLKYKGIVDCVASYKSTPSVIEWKVSQRAKPQLAFTYDAPLQLSAYLGALSYDIQHTLDLRKGLVVVAYKDGSPAEIFEMNEQVCRQYWNNWLKRVQLYWQSKS